MMLRRFARRPLGVAIAARGRTFHATMFPCSSAAAQAQPTKPDLPPPLPPGMINVTVDGKTIAINKDMTVLQACEQAGAVIPRFCYHPRLSIAGNCRMCLVEVVKSPKPVASCAMPTMPGMVIKTNTPLVKKAREGVMEFLLANHPLDCPICDQGGECDLQDLSVGFGSDRSRFREWKRTVEDKNMGPFVKTVMTRCIHCTRCIRFADEIAGVPVLGATGRGQTMEIGTYFEQPFDSELSGNVVDVCPVGALTSRPFAFSARPWELAKTESIDVHDGLGCYVRIDSRGSQVLRIQPRLNDAINEEWISDRSRFAYDGLKRQRLDAPLVKDANGKFSQVTWPEALSAVASAIARVNASKNMRALAGDLVDAEGLTALKDWFNQLGSTNIDCRQDGSQVCADNRTSYLFNSTIAGIEKADVLLVVGSNLRMEAAVLNARVRRCVVEGKLQVASIGPTMNQIYDCDQLGDDAAILDEIASGNHSFSSLLKSAKNPMILLGQSVFRRSDYDGLRSAIAKIGANCPNLFAADWNGVSVLQLTAARSAALDLGIVPGPTANNKDTKFVYLLGADDFDQQVIPSDAFVVYQGHHGDKGAARADVILPSTAYTEASGIYVNTEGRPQMTSVATGPIGQARPDWTIIRALSELTLPSPLPFNTLEEIRSRVYQIAPHLEQFDQVQKNLTINGWSMMSSSNSKSRMSGPLAPAVDNFFTTNVIARASKNMARAVAELPLSTNSYVVQKSA